jgi:hypothetical protein
LPDQGELVAGGDHLALRAADGGLLLLDAGAQHLELAVQAGGARLVDLALAAHGVARAGFWLSSSSGGKATGSPGLPISATSGRPAP